MLCLSFFLFFLNMICLSDETYSSGKSAGGRMEILVTQRPWNGVPWLTISEYMRQVGFDIGLRTANYRKEVFLYLMVQHVWSIPERRKRGGAEGGGMRRIRRTAYKHLHHKVSNGAKSTESNMPCAYVLASDYHEARTQKYAARAHTCTHRNARAATSSFPQESRFPDPVSCLLSVHLTSDFRLVGTFFCWLLLSSCSVESFCFFSGPPFRRCGTATHRCRAAAKDDKTLLLIKTIQLLSG